jgi:hypothetical protein
LHFYGRAGVVETFKNGKKVLYYEMFFQPKNKSPTIPIAGMLAERQTQPQITDFLNKVRYAEKLLTVSHKCHSLFK